MLYLNKCSDYCVEEVVLKLIIIWFTMMSFQSLEQLVKLTVQGIQFAIIG